MLQFREDVNRLLAIINSERELHGTEGAELLNQAERLGERFLKIEKCGPSTGLIADRYHRYWFQFAVRPLSSSYSSFTFSQRIHRLHGCVQIGSYIYVTPWRAND